MTENCSFRCTRPDDTHPDDPLDVIIHACGRSGAGFELKIWRQDNPDEEAMPGEVGELGGRGACLMPRYFNDQEVTERWFNRGGWFMSGDPVEIGSAQILARTD